MRTVVVARAAIVAVLILVTACSNPVEPVKITAIVLGGKINDDKSISSMQETFAPSSTVYASISTEGGGQATLAARWTAADGRLLAEQTQTIDPTRASHYEFHLAPEGAWPVGRHKVVFTLNGGAARTREFEVR
jgi:hypothetical protein